MSKSSKGNTEQNGKQVHQKSGLNRAILDQGFGESCKTQAKFERVECGYENRADLVGKVNVLARGLARVGL